MHSGSGDVKRCGRAADLPHTVQSLQILECRRRHPPPARPPVPSQTIRSEMSHRQERASPGMLGSERGGQGRRDLGAGPPPNPHPYSPCSRTPLPANDRLSLSVPNLSIHYPHCCILTATADTRGDRGGHLLARTPRTQLCLDDPNKSTQAEGLMPPVLSPAIKEDFTEEISQAVLTAI